MEKCAFARRLKRIIREECEVVKAEGNISKKSVKHYEEISSLKTTLAQNELECSKYDTIIENLKQENDRLEKYMQREEDRIREIMNNVKEMQIEYDRTLQQQIKQRQKALLQMSCIRNIKLATQTYINLNALPEKIQGVSIIEKEFANTWKPFKIDSTKHTQDEIQKMIWDNSHVESVHKEHWEALIFSDINSDCNTKLEEMKTDSDFVTFNKTND